MKYCKQMTDAERWPFIKSYCHRMGSFPYYVAEQFEAARQLNAPRDTFAIYERENKFYRVSACDQHTRERFERNAGITVAEVLA